MDYTAFVNGNKTMLIAPAGYGKTYTIAECLKYTTGRQLILTHTHAGIASIKEKIKTAGIESKKYHIETICGFAQKYATAFYTGNDLLPQEDKKYFPFLTDKARDYFCIEQVKKVIRISYAGLFVDEYQDCSKKQHKMIIALSEILPTHILGDPMQGIFDFNDDLIDLNTDIKDFEISQLDTPHRWYNNDRKNLGDALKSMRESLKNRKCIDLNEYKDKAKDGLYILPIGQTNIYDKESDYRKWIKGLLENPKNKHELDSLLLLVPNIFAKSNIHARVKLRNQIDYAKNLVLIEAMDEKDLYTVATKMDNIISAPGLHPLKDCILSFILVLQGFLWVKHSAHQSNLNLSS